MGIFCGDELRNSPVTCHIDFAHKERKPENEPLPLQFPAKGGIAHLVVFKSRGDEVWRSREVYYSARVRVRADSLRRVRAHRVGMARVKLFPNHKPRVLLRRRQGFLYRLLYLAPVKEKVARF